MLTDGYDRQLERLYFNILGQSVCLTMYMASSISLQKQRGNASKKDIIVQPMSKLQLVLELQLISWKDCYNQLEHLFQCNSLCGQTKILLFRAVDVRAGSALQIILIYFLF